MRLVLGVDFETSGLDPKVSSVIEVGAVLFDWDRKVPVDIYSQITDEVSAVLDDITRLTGITNEDIKTFGAPGWKDRLDDMEDDALAVMIHNADFDTQFWKPTNKLPIIDTLYDLPLKKDHGSMKLNYLAADHGFINPFPHRAVFDVLTMLKVASHYDLDEMLTLAKSPRVLVQAMVSYDFRLKAKDAGFRWDGEKKRWVLGMKEIQYKPEDYNFPTQLVK